MIQFKNTFKIFFCLLLIPCNLLFASQPNNCSFADVVVKLSPAVVNISTTQLIENNGKNFPFSEIPEEFFKFFDMPDEFKKSPFSDKPSKIISLGSGFLIDEKGHIVTNNHVIDNAQEINITVGDNEKKIYKAKVIGKDKKTDLALLKIDAKEPIPFVKFGNSDNARVGEPVIAIGNAFGFGGTVTSGIISAKGRHLGGQFYEEFIQTDASINKGNSGGPMFSMNGEVIGVNSAIVSPSGGNVGIGFAIPSNTAKSIISKLLKDGKIDRPWLGITFQPVTENIAKGFNLSNSDGAIVSNIIKDSPAEKAGINIGDIIVKFNNIILNNINSFPKLVADSPLNTKIPIQIIRKGKIINLNVQLEIPKSDPFNQNIEDKAVKTTYHGIEVVNLTKNIRNNYGISDEINGVLVTKIDKSSDAYKKGLQTGDIIININQDAVKSAKQFITLLTNIKLKSKKDDATAVLLVSRKNNNFYITIDLY
ncbi:Do family serine endopeptidase [Rickettsiales endosymbiont of Trichoplax sp. H2]|uniref:Do family serine endopeptidase n=1 Tax=Rickettsiales endosymbiont of Trichoplax sp. H2 TaxID=2021221 RepID=UPI0012B38A76|nr:Do family serine endopeptidase [Rickettsiales endosymbiont of Trichoplax sp. H2]MSO13258.1 putative periplasmic serine endoprotease DegP-like [Rickettsiales endosymbiont of Trichoplax sp. H2]